jgi:hypothetical protein
MTTEQYDQVHDGLVEAGWGSPAGRLHHSSFGPPDNIMVYEVWATQEDYDAFGVALGPLIEAAGITMASPPDVMPVHNVE